MPDFGIFRGFNDKLFGDKLYAGQLPINLGLIGSGDFDLRLLDIYPNAAAAYSLRLLRATYTGSAIEVRRTNNDVADIGFTSTGELDTAALLAFTGTGALDNGFITTWYDQSGNGNDATQALALSQPKIVSSGSVITENGKPALDFDGSNDYMTATSFLSQNEFLIFKPTSSNTARILQLRNTSDNLLMITADGRIRKDTNISSFNGPLWSASTNQNLITTIDSITAYENSVLITNTDSFGYGLGSGNNLFLGCRSDLAAFYNGLQQEFVFYNSDQSSNRTGIEDNINDFYSIY
jgi:hypothetical protein